MGGVDRVAAARTMSMWAVALLPLALYLLWIGVMHLRRRPTLVSGSRDILAVFLAAFGAVALGPMELFMPEAAAVRFGPLAWLQLVILYVLNVALVVLIMRPRAVLYNMTREQARTALARVLEQLGAPAVWAGDTLAVPAWELEVRLDQSGILRQVQLISVGPRTSYEGWVRLREALRHEIRGTVAERDRRAAILVAIAAALLLLSAAVIAFDPRAVADALREKLRW